MDIFTHHKLKYKLYNFGKFLKIYYDLHNHSTYDVVIIIYFSY